METVKIPKYHFKDRIKHQYNDIPLAILRELIQNSRDAGARNMWFEFQDGYFSCTDDGHSMTEQEFRDYYLNLGGTLKRTDSIGGFGAAKELTFAADSWNVFGKYFVCRGEGCQYTIEPFSISNGFILSAYDASYKKSLFEYALKSICRKSLLPLKIWVKAGNEFLEMSQGRKLHHNQMLWDFGFARLYAPQKFENAGFAESGGHQYIRTKGLLTKAEWVGSEFMYYLEIDEPLKILTENREGLREEYARKIKEEIATLAKKGLGRDNNHRQITLYGIPKQRYNARIAHTDDSIPVYVNGTLSANLMRVEYENETGQPDWPVEESDPPDENPIVTELDEAALAEIESIETTLGLLKFAHKKLQYWNYPFAIIEDGVKAIGVFSRDNQLTDRAKKCLTLTLTVGKMLSHDLAIPCPIPAILFSNEAESLNTKSGPYELLAILPEILMGDDDRGTPFGILEVFIHEFAHHWQSGHYESYELQRMKIARTIGSKIDVYLNVIKGLQNA